eukprot:CAMPEP_0171056704 /NCGR_PEP_ID=MMETSP0766_2-20121228/1231_1 /TAXON_ID=439317 /ORGANISM="Gambierdiscus australes, Strain CAWD 149" /LENGTH=336 /DNA_ID=CAMNT_0011511671 /DNA_START=41 /DNA_END=1048 /DNA_ORIENTATION=+
MTASLPAHHGRSLIGLALGLQWLLRSLRTSRHPGFVGADKPVHRSVHTSLGARKFIIGGNWKANGSPASVKQLVDELNAGELEVDASKDVEVVCAPPFVFLSEVQSSLRKDYSVAAQNLWHKEPGAWTGEIPGQMLVDMGVEWVVLGHSERRENSGETSQLVAEKTKFAIDKGLRVITCIGERLEAREAGTTFDVLDEQMRPLAAALSEPDWGGVVLAYEPVWAIGTGKVATPDQAEEVHAFLRQWLTDNVSEKVSASVRIQYGGSVNDKNSAELGQKPNIDGFLVGGASLKGTIFTTIINSAKSKLQAREGQLRLETTGGALEHVWVRASQAALA